MASTFTVNPALAERIARSPQIMAALAAGAQRGAMEARRIARAEAYDTGDYHDGIEAGVGMDNGRPQARIKGTDWKSHWVERGGLHTPARHVLSRGAEAAGLSIGGDG